TACAVDGDVVGFSGDGGEDEGAGFDELVDGVVVVIGQALEGGDGGAGVDAEECVEGAAEGVEGDQAVEVGGPGVPDGLAGGGGVALFLGGVGAGACELEVGAGGCDGAGEVVVGGRGEDVDVHPDGTGGALVAVDQEVVGGTGDGGEGDGAGLGAVG